MKKLVINKRNQGQLVLVQQHDGITFLLDVWQKVPCGCGKGKVLNWARIYLTDEDFKKIFKWFKEKE